MSFRRLMCVFNELAADAGQRIDPIRVLQSQLEMARNLVVDGDVRVNRAHDRANIRRVRAKVTSQAPAFDAPVQVLDPALLFSHSFGLALSLLLGLFFAPTTLGDDLMLLVDQVHDDVEVSHEIADEGLDGTRAAITPVTMSTLCLHRQNESVRRGPLARRY